MDIEKLIERMNNHLQSLAAYSDPELAHTLEDAATALSVLQAENAEMQKQLNEFSEFLCRMTGNLLSKTNYTAQAMIEAAEDYQQRVCDDCDLRAENEKLREELEQERAHRLHAEQHADAFLEDCKRLNTELEQVKAERDAAVEDVAAIIGDVEEIRRGYGVDNADADGAFAELCGTYCANKGRSCYAECEKYHCKNFKWRGQKED